jgi:hypothetical protein
MMVHIGLSGPTSNLPDIKVLLQGHQAVVEVKGAGQLRLSAGCRAAPAERCFDQRHAGKSMASSVVCASHSNTLIVNLMLTLS